MTENEPIPETINYAVRKAGRGKLTIADNIILAKFAQGYGLGIKDFLKLHKDVTATFDEAKREVEARHVNGGITKKELRYVVTLISNYRFLETTANIRWLKVHLILSGIADYPVRNWRLIVSEELGIDIPETSSLQHNETA